jgi:hypothetical protein
MFKRHWRKFLLAIVLVPVLLVVAPETGLIAVGNYRVTSHFDSQWHEQMENTQYFKEYATPPPAETQLTVAPKSSGRDTSIVCSRIASGLLENKFTGEVSAELKTWTIEGPCWIPLKKSGKLTFEVAYDANIRRASKALKVKGTASGTLDCSVSGWCGYLEYRAILAREIGQQIADKLKQDVEE